MRPFIRLALCFLVMCSSLVELRASDASGGNIWYEFIGDSLNPYEYRVYIQIYQNVNGLNIGVGPKALCVSSSCFPTINLLVPFQPVYNQSPPLDSLQGRNPGSILTPWLTECVDSNSTNIAFTEIQLYSMDITLPGKCSDFVFSLAACCRRTYDNIVTTSNLYLSTSLNNTLGPNSSPRFTTPAAKSFCLNHRFYWPQGAIEPDGDSLMFSLSNPKTSTGCNPPTSLLFQTGYSLPQPISTVNGVYINPKNGELRFTPAQLEVASFNIKVDEYRKIGGGWHLISSTERGLEYSAVASCKSSIINGPLFKRSSYLPKLIDRDSILSYGISLVFSTDSVPDSSASNGYLLSVPVLEYSCFDSLVVVKFKTGVACQSISADGSDFRIIGPDSILRPVVGVEYTCDPTAYTSEIGLLLHRPLDVNGDYFLVVKTGNDQNTLVSKCGFEMPVGSVAIVRVEDCTTPEYDLLNASVELDKQVNLTWKADSTTYAPDFFNAWKVYRGDGNGIYYFIDEIKHHRARSYVDTLIGPGPLDFSSFHYKIDLRQNYTDRGLTRSIKTILLNFDQRDSSYPQDVHFHWSDYNGWQNPHYQLFIGKVGISPTNITWKNIKGPDSNFFSFSHSFPKITHGSDNLYAAKVRAHDLVDTSNHFISESNWVYIRLKYNYPPAENAPTYFKVPNVFTPNGDGQNDFFTIDSDFKNINISIFNRWGRLVFQEQNSISEFSWDGRDMTTGNKLPDGVYYYLAAFKSQFGDGAGGFRMAEDSSQGNVTIFSSGNR